ncbi:MAG: hypothetical protein MJY85_01230 [Fibrobacter sp.]|nr:hypothetical protein [Fibrobacter sp.]
MFNKKGVSLVTVMLFMLVATIAATATYKWLSSEQRSSASRMKIAEAQQASRAGLESVRAWMTFHANDVGALMHQYVAGNKKPIKLDDVVRQFGSTKQNYSVWLTGVEGENAPYRLKITSVGKTRDNTKYSEVSILKVDGLYRVKVPVKTTGISFDQAFAGQHAGVTGSDSLESALITGNFATNNTPAIYSKVVVTGSANYGGNITHTGDVYIGKDVSATGMITIGNATSVDTLVAYVGGNVTCANGQPFTVYGDLYLAGNVGNCILDVKGNLTVAGKLSVAFNNNNIKVTVGKNLVFTETGVLDYPRESYSSITVGENVYLPDKIEGHCTSDCADQNKQRLIKANGKVYRYNKTHYYEILKQNNAGTEYGIYMQNTNQNDVLTNENNRKNKRITTIVGSSYESASVSSWNKNDNVLKNVTGQYWQKIEKMNAYGNLIVDNAIPQPILIDNETAWKAKRANAFCGGSINNKDGKFDMDDAAVDALNSCYVKAVNDGKILYNEYLIIQWNYTNNKQPSHTLDHKFVLYSTEKLGGDPYLPGTSDDGYVLLYLEKGAGQLNAKTEQEHNYVIYSKEDIDQINGLKMTGTMILEPGKKLLKTQGQTRLQFGKSVVQSMADAGLIKENPAYTSVANPSGSGSASSTTGGAPDSYYVGTSPQLAISLESQYKNNELDPDKLQEGSYSNISSSVIVMPRVLYLTQDYIGKLTDYFSVINLNKGTDNGQGNVTCNPTGLDASVRRDGKTLVPEDNYTCNYNSSYGNVPFYVVISGKNGTTPAVTFENPGFTNISAGGAPATINMVVKKATGSATMSVGVRVRNLPDTWTLVRQSSDIVEQSVGSGILNEKNFIVNFKANEATKALFTIAAPAGAGNNTVYFELTEPLNGCLIGTPSVYTVSISGSADINRSPIPQTYCTDHSTLVATNNQSYDCDDVTSADWPSCDATLQSGEWVYPSCNSLVTTDENNAWTCGTNLAISLQKQSVSQYCLAFIADTSLEAETGETYTLFASLKRKPVELYVKSEGLAGSATLEVAAAKSGDAGYQVLSSTTERNGYKVYQVYAGYRVKFTAKDFGSNVFSKWACRGDDCVVPSYDKETYESLLITSSDTLVATFNRRDDHCFFDTFGSKKNSKNVQEDFKVFCPNNTYENCVDYCASDTDCSIRSGEGHDPEANWMIVHSNHKSWSTHYNDFEEPKLKDGLIRAPGTLGNLGAALGAYRPTVMLNRVKAGSNGKMSLKMKVPTDFTETFDDLVGKGDNFDDGVILRSNIQGTKYLSVNLYKGSLISEKQPGAWVRVCYVEGIENKGKDCIATSLKNNLNGNYVPLKSLHDVTMNVVLNGASLDVTFDYNFSGALQGSHDVGNAHFDLSRLNNTSLSYGATDYEYIGLKMFNTFYFYKDITWTSRSYESDCYAAPQIYCSFANKFIGGTVPLNTDVSPWVGKSSWFDENTSECATLTYHYNGCDMPNNLYVSYPYFMYQGNSWACGSGNIGGFWDKGAELAGSTYKFQEEGYHKIDTTMTLFNNYQLSGYAKNATVQVVCGSTTYTSDCGQFYVGEIVSCTKHEEFLENNSSKYCSVDPCVFEPQPVANDLVNLRDANLLIAITGLSGVVEVQLVDKNNVSSDKYTITADGSYSIDVNLISDVNGFDPQNIKKVVINGATGYTVTQLQSSCGNVASLSNCSATFDGHGFRVSATVNNPNNAAKNGCTLSSADDLFNDKSQDCEAELSYYVPVSGIYEGMAASDTKSFTFDIEMQDKENVRTSCPVKPVATVKKSSIYCVISTNEIYAGDEWPYMQYYITNCPTGGCNATIEVDGKTSATDVTYDKNCETGASCESLNWRPTDLNSAAGDYKYVVKFPGATDCSVDVKVNAVEGAKASDCRVVDGTFYANLTPPSNGATSKVQLYYNDVLGNKVGSEESFNTSGYVFSQPLSGITAPGTYTLALAINGTAACSATHTVEAASSSSNSSSASTGSSSSVAGAVSATCGVSTHDYDISGENEFYTGSNLYFVAKNNKNQNETVSVNVFNGSRSLGTKTLNGNSNWSKLYDIGSKLTVGSYTYSIKIGDNEICSHTISVKNPTANCVVSESKTALNSKITFSASFAPNNRNAKVVLTHGSDYLENQNNYWLGNDISKEVTMGTAGSHKFTLSIEDNVVCERTVEVSEGAPSFDCDQITVIPGESNNVVITPKNVSGCTEGCSYVIEGTSVTNSSFDYTTGALPAFTGNGSDGDVVSYNVSLTNSEETTTKSCKVRFSDPSVFPCNDGNSTPREWHAGNAQDFESESGTCIKYNASSGKLQIGCWWAPETPVNVSIKHCDGTVETISHKCSGWESVSVDNSCNVYITNEKKIKWDFSNW